MTTPHDELDLRRRLRQLPRERAAQRDLWRGIEARLDAMPPASLAPAPRPWLRPALAAAAVLGLGLAVLWRPASSPPVPQSVQAPVMPTAAPNRDRALLRREAEAITYEYRLAIGIFASAPLPPALHVATAELDASAQLLREALREQPDATYLLDRLRRTYEQRLRLTQRAALG